METWKVTSSLVRQMPQADCLPSPRCRACGLLLSQLSEPRARDMFSMFAAIYRCHTCLSVSMVVKSSQLVSITGRSPNNCEYHWPVGRHRLHNKLYIVPTSPSSAKEVRSCPHILLTKDLRRMTSQQRRLIVSAGPSSQDP